MVTLYDVLEVTGGHIYPSDGAAHFEVQLTSFCSTLDHQSAVPETFTTKYFQVIVFPVGHPASLLYLCCLFLISL